MNYGCIFYAASGKDITDKSAEKPVDIDTLEPERPNEEGPTPEEIASTPTVQDDHKELFGNKSL